MTYMLCRNRVKDFARWKAVFSSHADAHREASALDGEYHFVEDAGGY